MQPILCTEPMELVHIDYVGMEITVAAKEKPVVKNVLVVVDTLPGTSRRLSPRIRQPTLRPESCTTSTFQYSDFHSG